ncbi:MAG: DUF1365 domain-containing protein [Elioraea sp.]|nr:DUF1365 domain-containing protein [Elioraea sp.]
MSEAPAQLLTARVVHVRHRPFRHRLEYRIWSLLLDLDRAEEAARSSRLFRLERPGLVSFRARDHGARDGSPLRPWVERQLAAQGIPPPAAIRLLALPRVFGYVFNPISLFLCSDATGRDTAVVYEVKNTFGDQHAYVAALAGRGPHRHAADKTFHVSPFIGMDARYRFTLSLKDDRFGLLIDETEGGERLLTASMVGRLEPMTDAALARALLRFPFVTLKVIAGIHWHALQLWRKGARYHRYLPPPEVEPTPAR